MIVTRDGLGITVQRAPRRTNYVRIGVLKTHFQIDNTQRCFQDNTKPHDQYTLAELEKLLLRLETIERYIERSRLAGINPFAFSS